MKEEEVISEAKAIEAEVSRCLDRIDNIPNYFPKEMRRELARMLIGEVVLCSINATMKLIQEGLAEKITDIMENEQIAKRN